MAAVLSPEPGVVGEGRGKQHGQADAQHEKREKINRPEVEKRTSTIDAPSDGSQCRLKETWMHHMTAHSVD